MEMQKANMKKGRPETRFKTDRNFRNKEYRWAVLYPKQNG